MRIPIYRCPDSVETGQGEPPQGVCRILSKHSGVESREVCRLFRLAAARLIIRNIVNNCKLQI